MMHRCARVARSWRRWLQNNARLHHSSSPSSAFTALHDGFTRPVTIDDYEAIEQPRNAPLTLRTQQRAIPPLPPLSLPSLATATDTVYQLTSGFQSQSGHQSVGVAVVRVSGPLAHYVAQLLTRRSKPFKPRYATHCSLYDPTTHSLIDSPCLALVFPSPHSYTGEDVVEFHCHGNPIIVTALMRALQSLSFPETHHRVREADAGEFTRRAFDNGKLDLTQVEALSDLLTARTEHQHSQSIHQLQGSLSQLYDSWRLELIGLLAHCEAIIDFGEDEPDVSETDIVTNIAPRIHHLLTLITGHVNDNNRGELIRDGVEAVIVGNVNTGKSTLLNTLAKREIAIVSHHAGTTRDIIECAINITGYSVKLIDTAGLRVSSDEVENEGIKRARSRASNAAIRIMAIDSVDYYHSNAIDSEIVAMIDSHTIVLLTKIDLLQSLLASDTDHPVVDKHSQLHTAALRQKFRSELATPVIDRLRASLTMQPAAIIGLSCHDGSGLNDLITALSTSVRSLLSSNAATGTSTLASNDSSQPLITRARHRQHLLECVESLERALRLLRAGDLVLCSESLRASLLSLGRIIGRVDVEEVLDVLFRDFCIGK